MILGISGTRNPAISYVNFVEILNKELYELGMQGIMVTELCSGGAKGIDTFAKQYAEEKGLELKEFIPDYDNFGKIAPMVRNSQIVIYSDFIIAFPSVESKGTLDTIKKAKKVNKLHKIYSI